MKEKDKQKVYWMLRKSPLRLLIIVALSIFIAEAVVMAMLNFFEAEYKIPETAETFMDSAVLVFLLTPVLFFLFFYPLLLHIKEKKRVEEELLESKKRLQYLSSQILTAQEQERMRISRELHDGLGQDLNLLKLRLRGIEKQLYTGLTMSCSECEETRAHVDQIIENVRRISRDLSPVVLEDLGLSSAVKQMVKKFIRHHDIDMHLDIGDIDRLFTQKTGIVLYRIVQESLTNVSRHSGATSVSVILRENDGMFYFLVEDNGRGFDAAQALDGAPLSKGLGIATLKERVRMLGGALELRSQKGEGTRVGFSIPVKKEEFHHELISHYSCR